MYGFLYYQVRDIMTPDPVSITSDVLLAEAETIFEKTISTGSRSLIKTIA